MTRSNLITEAQHTADRRPLYFNTFDGRKICARAQFWFPLARFPLQLLIILTKVLISFSLIYFFSFLILFYTAKQNWLLASFSNKQSTRVVTRKLTAQSFEMMVRSILQNL